MPKLDIGQWIFLSVCVAAIAVGFLVGNEAIGGAIVAAILGFIGSIKGGVALGRKKRKPPKYNE